METSIIYINRIENVKIFYFEEVTKLLYKDNMDNLSISMD